MMSLLQTGGTVGLGRTPLYLLYLILPGLGFIKAMTYMYKYPDILSRYDRIGYALTGSVLSGILFLLSLRSFVRGYYPVSTDDFEGMSIIALLIGVIIHAVFAGALGSVFGGILRHMSDQDRDFDDRQQPWSYTADEIREEEVIVRTNVNGCIQGIIARYGQGEQSGDIVISPVDPDDREELNIADSDETDALYITQRSISEIHFVEDEGEEEYDNMLPQGDLETDNDSSTDHSNSTDDADEEQK